MYTHLKEQLYKFVKLSLEERFPDKDSFPTIEIEIPKEKIHGDLSCNIALKSAKVLRKSPLELAKDFCPILEQKLSQHPQLKDKIAKIEIKAPGFINFTLSVSAVCDVLLEVFNQEESYGRGTVGAGKKIQIEFVSANPTGPLSVAHARQAAVGDALVNILNCVGYKAEREFYVNDEGNQINILGRSIQQRALEILGETVEFAEDNYQGDYIRDMAQIFLDQNSAKTLEQAKDIPVEKYREFGVEYLLEVINKELDDFGVHFDIWSYQSEIATEQNILKMLQWLQDKGFVYEKEGALWFKSTMYGDDKDRVVRKSDGSYTYFMPDIVYHQDKFKRGFDKIVNMWGPDHHGYIPRLTAVVQALGYNKEALQIIIVQLATIFRDGKPVSMSTRRGQYISMREVLEEVGRDAARYFFLMRHTNAQLEFDLELAKKETPENPVYYIQYAHARIYSIMDKAREAGALMKKTQFELLNTEEEMDLIKKIGLFPDVLILCERAMDPYDLVTYLLELATCFHRLYDRHRIVDSEHLALSGERLGLVEAVRIVLGNGLKLLGIQAPKKM